MSDRGPAQAGQRGGRTGPARHSSAELDDRPELVLDEFDEKLNAFNAFRKSDTAAADAILDQVGASDDVDRRLGDGTCRVRGAGLYGLDGQPLRSIDHGQTLVLRMSVENVCLSEDCAGWLAGSGYR